MLNMLMGELAGLFRALHLGGEEGKLRAAERLMQFFEAMESHRGEWPKHGPELAKLRHAFKANEWAWQGWPQNPLLARIRDRWFEA
jgi:hypothetical protein